MANIYTTALASGSLILASFVAPAQGQVPLSPPAAAPGVVVNHNLGVTHTELEFCKLLRPTVSGPGERPYIVRTDDTLSGIAFNTYGQVWATEPLRENNNKVLGYTNHDRRMRFIPDNYTIKAGQMIPLIAANEINQWARATIAYRNLTPEQKSAPVTIKGSGTVFPLVRAASICFEHADIIGIPGVPEFDGDIIVDGSGTRYGRRELCSGGADIATASDRYTDAELRADGCDEAKIKGLREFVIARDPIVVARSRRNPSYAQAGHVAQSRKAICDLFANGPAAEGLTRYLPTLNSGTAQVVGRLLCGNENLLDGTEAVTRTEDYDYLASKVAQDSNGVAVIGYAFYAHFAKDLVILEPDGVGVSFQNIASGAYPLKRDLYLYTFAETLSANPHVFDWMNFMVASTSALLENIAYFPVSSEVRHANEAELAAILAQP